MQELKCPKCGTTFKVDEQDYESILKQIKNKEFIHELEERTNSIEREKDTAIKLAETKLENKFNEELNKKDNLINELNNKIKTISDNIEKDKSIERLDIERKYNETISKKDIEINELKNKIKLKESETDLMVKNAIIDKDKDITILKNKIDFNKESYERTLKDKDEQIEYYRDLKAKSSTKMIGENLEQHCSNEFNTLRPLFSRAYFEKDNDARTGSKGDFIFKDYDEEGTEIVSIMFEMKNEADTTSTKHKNEDFLKELDKDRQEKGCEYAVLVSLLEIDSDYYNTGIVDMSYRYPKMYVIRPQFFIPIITLLRNAAMNSLSYKKELLIAQSQNIDISNFENNINEFKEGFSRNYRLASEKFAKAIEEIDKSIKNLQNTKEALLSSEKNLRLANDKADSLTIRKMTSNAPSVAKMFKEKESEKDVC